ncbi:hypothetical protein [Spirillospora sp. CA-294931]|uniref:hypothetical protein n=1 Tax=Spirillospora sp. CA-294931 TaxID=3240042 RepID=UPI003D920048
MNATPERDTISDTATRIILRESHGRLAVTDSAERARELAGAVVVCADSGPRCVHAHVGRGDWQLWDDGGATLGRWLWDEQADIPSTLAPAAAEVLTLVFGAANRAQDWADRASWHPLRDAVTHETTVTGHDAAERRIPAPGGRVYGTGVKDHTKVLRHHVVLADGRTVTLQEVRQFVTAATDDPFEEYTVTLKA